MGRSWASRDYKSQKVRYRSMTHSLKTSSSILNAYFSPILKLWFAI
jgi:hypothetical protein